MRARFSPLTGELLVTGSYDGTVKVWSARDFSPLATLRGHDNKVTAVDIAAAPMGCGSALAEAAIVSVSFDRTIKVWGVDA